MKKKVGIIIAGVVVGAVALCLSRFGNPANMALCIACFIRDISGALGLHGSANVQYIRPEIIGIVIGAFIISLVKKEFSPTGGSSPLTRFVLGVCVMIGALVFLGCPLRMVLRIAGGDLNAVIGLVGFAGGILTGILFLNKGFSLRRAYKQPAIEGVIVPAAKILLLVALIAAPAFILFSETGPGSLHAPILISLAGGLIVGAVAQRSRICFVGGIRDAVMFKDISLLLGFAAILATVFVGNLLMGSFKLGLADQPIAHTEWIWNILGLYVVGFGSVLLGGCPLRQLILAGGGNSDSGVTLLGLLGGAAICHNFGLASSGAGATTNGKIACIAAIAVVFAIAALNTRKTKA